jgi:methylthioribose-1-phosphate isomerase
MGESVSILDQRKLPLQEIYNDYGNYIGVAEAIRSMEVRGAPAIGITAAMGIALAAKNFKGRDLKDFRETMDGVLLLFAETRPTAVNLFWAIERMRSLVSSGSDIDSIIDALVMEAVNILEEDIAINRTMGKNGSRFLSDGDVVMTHCNAGSLATGGYGTALGVIRAAVEEGKKIEVIACETRPYLQGARLTAWELQKDNIPVTVITDNMAGFFMKKGLVKKIIVGADRVAANGDTANKIGTYSHAVLARHHGIPFYVAAPVSTLDINTHTGGDIVIEERSVDEVAYVGSVQIVPEGVRIYNPAFDVTPAELISAIITEKGVIEEPAGKGISSLVSA